MIEQAVERIAARAPQRLIEQRDRLRAAVQELAGGIAIDEQRLAQEIAFMADRLDVSEEISRFHSHFAAFRATLASPSADGVGKRLGFLLQELLREANTTGSKANDAAMLHEVGHNHGRSHAPCAPGGGITGVDPNYPCVSSSI